MTHMELMDRRLELVCACESLDALLQVLDWNADQYGPSSLLNLVLFVGDDPTSCPMINGCGVWGVWHNRSMPDREPS